MPRGILGPASRCSGTYDSGVLRSRDVLALTSVWIGLASLFIAGVMLGHRAMFGDLGVTLVLYFGSPGALCLGGLVLWAYRKEDSSDPGVLAQRLQAKVAIILALVAAAVVYALIIASDKIVFD